MSDTLQDPRRLAEVQRERADRLEAEVERLETRLTEAEAARSADAADAARLRGELERHHEDQELIVTRITAPLRIAERGLRWLIEKAGKVLGVLARHAAFRRRPRS